MRLLNAARSSTLIADDESWVIGRQIVTNANS
jgi:hypothetical protein